MREPGASRKPWRQQEGGTDVAVTTSASGYASIYILGATILGAIVGTAFGAVFDGVIEGRRTLAVLAALVVIAVDYLVRRFFGRTYAQVFRTSRASLLPPPPLLLVAAITALAGGLATHDLGLAFGILSGPALGGGAGLFAGLMTAALAVLLEEHRKPMEH